MNERLYTIAADKINTLSNEIKQQALCSLEQGKVIFCPSFAFMLTPEENSLLSAHVLDKGRKNISYHCHSRQLAGFSKHWVSDDIKRVLQTMMHRFSQFCEQLIRHVFPRYGDPCIWGRTSYRPAEIKDRKTSKRQDDTRLHIDSFSSTPVDGRRILRVFCNINPYQIPRVWYLGDPFPEVLRRFLPTFKPYKPWWATLLNWTHSTKTLRGPYDHYMLQLHDNMKLDDQYQQSLDKYRMDFPSQSTWIAYTDQVSHAALSGQFLLEQTFYLPVSAMQCQEQSPYCQLSTLL